jgi:mannitol-specific phosphotransferase system IIBC component
MKKTDIAMVILIASLSVLVAYFVANALVGDMVSESVQVKTVDPISSEISEPNKGVFNSNAINPTVEVIIGGSVDVSQLDR